MAVPWSAGSVAPKSKMKHPQPHYSRNLALRILWQYFSVGRWDGMVMWSVLGPVSDLSQTYRFPAPEGKEGLEQHGLNVSKLISMNVHMAWLALSRKTKMHGEPVFDIAWCCQPHQMGHRQHPNLKMDITGHNSDDILSLIVIIVVQFQRKDLSPHHNKSKQDNSYSCEKAFLLIHKSGVCVSVVYNWY